MDKDARNESDKQIADAGPPAGGTAVGSKVMSDEQRLEVGLDQLSLSSYDEVRKQLQAFKDRAERAEKEKEEEKQRAEEEKQRAEKAEKEKEDEKQRAERAEEEKQVFKERAEKAEALTASAPKEADDFIMRTPLVDPSMIRNAFVEPFVQRKKSSWLTEARNVALSFNPSTHDAPCLVFFQSSGYGKSRLLLDGNLDATGDVLRLYFHCGFLDGQPQNGWPQFPVNEFLKKAFPEHGSQVLYINAVRKLKTFMLCALVGFFETGARRSSTVELKDGSGTLALRDSPRWRRWCSCRDESLEALEGRLLQDLIRAVSSHTGPTSIVMMVWDEAATMKTRVLTARDDRPPASDPLNISVRPIFRQACRDLHLLLTKTDVRVVHALVATTSNMKAAASVDISDSSLRFMMAQHTRYPPMTGLVDEHFDIFPVKQREPFDGAPVPDRADLDDLWQFGRPVWRSIQSMSGPDAKYQWAAAKLMCATDVSTLPAKVSPSASEFRETGMPRLLAILFARVAGLIIPSTQAEAMVASHMATAINYVDGSIVARYFSEPALAEGSKFVLRQMRWTMCAPEFVNSICTEMSKSPPHAGDLGEMAACMILLQVMDGADLRPTPSISAAEFLGRLVGPSWQEELRLRLCPGGAVTRSAATRDGAKFFFSMSHGMVSYNHFVRVKDVPQAATEQEWPKVLRWAWARQAAIICAAGQDLIDLVIPILHKVEDGKWLLGCLMVQVKNTEDLCPPPCQGFVLGWNRKEGGDMFPGAYVGLRLRSSDVEQHQTWNVTVSDSTPAFRANSFECLPCLDPGQRQALHNLCTLHRKPTNWVEGDLYNRPSEWH